MAEIIKRIPYAGPAYQYPMPENCGGDIIFPVDDEYGYTWRTPRLVIKLSDEEKLKIVRMERGGRLDLKITADHSGGGVYSVAQYPPEILRTEDQENEPCPGENIEDPD